MYIDISFYANIHLYILYIYGDFCIDEYEEGLVMFNKVCRCMRIDIYMYIDIYIFIYTYIYMYYTYMKIFIVRTKKDRWCLMRFVYIYICIQIRMHECMYMSIFQWFSINTIYTSLRIHIYVYIYMYIYVHIHICYTYLYVCMYLYVFIYISIYICIYREMAEQGLIFDIHIFTYKSTYIYFEVYKYINLFIYIYIYIHAYMWYTFIGFLYDNGRTRINTWLWSIPKYSARKVKVKKRQFIRILKGSCLVPLHYGTFTEV
jgi:hypothetical protein